MATTEYISRYDENNVDTFNGALDRLEVLALSRVNRMTPITTGTLTSVMTEINMDLGATSWAFLVLRATLTMTAANSTIVMRGNHDLTVDSRYYSALTETYSGTGMFGTSSPNYASLGRGDTNPAFIEATIWPNSLGFALIGRNSVLTTTAPAFAVDRFGSVYTGGTIATSLQLTIVSGSGSFAVGSTYRLEGVRA